MLTNESIEKRAREILSNLTLKEKDRSQLTQVHFSIEEIDKLKQEIADGKVGSVILSDTAFAGSEGKCSAAEHTWTKCRKPPLRKKQIENSDYIRQRCNSRT